MSVVQYRMCQLYITGCVSCTVQIVLVVQYKMCELYSTRCVSCTGWSVYPCVQVYARYAETQGQLQTSREENDRLVNCLEEIRQGEHMHQPPLVCWSDSLWHRHWVLSGWCPYSHPTIVALLMCVPVLLVYSLFTPCLLLVVHPCLPPVLPPPLHCVRSQSWSPRAQ